MLIIEKETFFNKLIQNGFFEMFPDCLLVTAKGYPDHQTKDFLLAIKNAFPYTTYFYLGDLDPHGIEIYLNYCFSNKLSVFEDHGMPFIVHIGLDFDQRLPPDKWALLNERDVDKIEQILDMEPIQIDKGSCPNYKAVVRMDKIRSTVLLLRRIGKKVELEALLSIPYLDPLMYIQELIIQTASQSLI